MNLLKENFKILESLRTGKPVEAIEVPNFPSTLVPTNSYIPSSSRGPQEQSRAKTAAKIENERVFEMTRNVLANFKEINNEVNAKSIDSERNESEKDPQP